MKRSEKAFEKEREIVEIDGWRIERHRWNE